MRRKEAGGASADPGVLVKCDGAASGWDQALPPTTGLMNRVVMSISSVSRTNGRFGSTFAVACVAIALLGSGCGNAARDGHESSNGGARGDTGGAGGVAPNGGRAGATAGATASGQGGSMGGSPSTSGASGALDAAGASGEVAGSGGAQSASGGTGGVGGDSNAAGNAGRGGDTGGCVEGVPCQCAELVGTTQCQSGVAACSCPPAEQCRTPSGAPCFEPCGGDPFGGWVMVDSCFRTSHAGVGTACERLVQAMPNGSDLRLRILDGGRYDLGGNERWSIQLSASLSCLLLDSVQKCSERSIGVNPFMFSSGERLPCKPNACGVCECAGDVGAAYSQESGSWTRQGNAIRLGNNQYPYCVKGDELWIGGGFSEDSPIGAYKFKRQSCQGTPMISCEQLGRTECARTSGCRMGSCEPLPATSADCAAKSEIDCNQSAVCNWNYETCSGKASCDFANCDSLPGCSWGQPVPRCGGVAQEVCAELDPKTCLVDHGCSIVSCWPGEEDCRRLNATECAKAPGCKPADPQASVACVGTAQCWKQADQAVCRKLGCESMPLCDGQIDCSSFTVAECHEHAGCRIEW
ncbi:MAG TPA: hypothetical protein VFQ35_09745 [Polyangiaceae bacterium]|nr:hypothetical protein [Polyangiaceae bacterium]